jgi:hypothetical protein
VRWLHSRGVCDDALPAALLRYSNHDGRVNGPDADLVDGERLVSRKLDEDTWLDSEHRRKLPGLLGADWALSIQRFVDVAPLAEHSGVHQPEPHTCTLLHSYYSA